MKKQKLTLKTETIRSLQSSELQHAGGGSIYQSVHCNVSGGCTIGIASMPGRCGIFTTTQSGDPGPHPGE